MARAGELARAFAARFGRPPTHEASAPGRVNLIGEHTDYNDGFVLPTVIPQRTTVALAPRTDRRVRAWSADVATGVVEYELGAERGGRGWIDYVQGVTRALAARGQAVSGFELAIASDVPVGAGLSSSAALEIAVGRGLRALCGLAIDDIALAQVGQRGEHDIVGAPVGIMDQLAASVGRPGAALLIDIRTLAIRALELPAAAELVVISSGIAHDHAAGDYRTRRTECERAAALLGVPALRDVGVDALDRIAQLPPPLDRRARHVVTENARVLAAAAALERGDVAALGELFAASHRSQRDDFAVSIAAIDQLAELATADRDVIGARLTGGGFGGSIVALVQRGTGAAVAARVAAAFAATGRTPAVLVPAPHRPHLEHAS